MLKIKIFITAIYLTIISNVYAETVNKIEINGNKRISSETIKVYGQIKILYDYYNLLE